MPRLAFGAFAVEAWPAASEGPPALSSNCAMAIGKLVAVSGPRDIRLASMAVGCGGEKWLTALLQMLLPCGPAARSCCELAARWSGAMALTSVSTEKLHKMSATLEQIVRKGVMR